MTVISRKSDVSEIEKKTRKYSQEFSRIGESTSEGDDLIVKE
jgi:hypothetical protein